jgi:glycosyltransferase involved in cell wall biosynthesis
MTQLPLNILMVSKTLPHTFKGGIQTHVWELSKWLIKLGHHVSILTSGSIKKGFFMWEADKRKIIELPYLPGRKIPTLGLALEEYFFNRSVKTFLKNHAHKYDIVHLQGRSGYLFPEYNNKHHKTTTITTIHGIAKVESKNAQNSQTNLPRKIHAKFAEYFEYKQLKYSNGLIAVSTETKQMLRREFPDILKPVEIINNGIDINDFKPKNDCKENPNQLLFVGRLDAIKGIIPLIKTMELLPNAHLKVIGDGEEKENVTAIINKLKLKNVTLLGAQPIEEVRKNIYESYALVLPSFYETQGIVSMEANACMKPVAASNINGIKEVVKDGYNGVLFEPGNVKDMAEKITFLLNNKEEAKKMGKNGRKLMEEKFSWEKIARQTVQFYNRRLNK